MKITNFVLIFFIFFNKTVLAENKINGFKGSAGKFVSDESIKMYKKECEQGKKAKCKSLYEEQEHLKSLRSISDREGYLKKNNLPKNIRLKCSRNNNYDDIFSINMVSRSVDYEAIGRGNDPNYPKNKIISSTKGLHIEDSSIAEQVALSTFRKKKDNSYYLIFYQLDINKKKLYVRFRDNLTESDLRQWHGYNLALVVKNEPKEYNCTKLANKDQSKLPPWFDGMMKDIDKAGGVDEWAKKQCAKGIKSACDFVKSLKK